MIVLPEFIEYGLVIFAAIGLALAAVYLLSRPFKWLYKWILNGICGVIILYLLSFFGSGFGLDVPFNAVTVVISALLGIPGVVLILLKMLLF